jgi:hypothetical protein
MLDVICKGATMRMTTAKRAEETEFIVKRETVLDTLRHGALIVRATGQPLSARNVIWQLIRFSMETAHSISDREASWLRAASRSHMPQFVRSYSEYWQYMFARLTDARFTPQDVADPVKIHRLEPTDLEFDRMCIVFSMLKFINTSRDPMRMQRCIMALASGASTHRVARMYRPGCKVHRSAINEMKVRACRRIEIGLLEEYGIVWRHDGFGV